MTVLSSEEEVNFVADARLISVLGEQLIGSEKVGILELIKNAYDAGATTCEVFLEGVPGLEPNTRLKGQYADLPGPIIEIRDDGSGMSREELIQGWLRPATSRRARAKDVLRVERETAIARGSSTSFDALVAQLRDAHGGRLPLGEKGIGRLATHRLGRYLWLRTKFADDPLEWEIKIDWSLFDSLEGAPVDLSKVPLILTHQSPTASYSPRDSGTVICCYGGRAGYEWTPDQIIDVGRAVNSLRSPYRGPKNFLPTFVSPHVSEQALGSPLERVEAPFELLAVVDVNGGADIEIKFLPPGILSDRLKPFTSDEPCDLRTTDTKYWQTADKTLRQSACGPFILHIRAWLRMREWLGTNYTDLTTYLDQFGGITIYRDGLATFPAEQSAKVDWLGLQISQIKRSANISYYHLAGEIELVQEQTLALRDRSSREGMIQTQAYRDLAKLTRAAVDRLQFQIQRIRTEWKKSDTARVPRKTLLSYVNAAMKVAEALRTGYDFKHDALSLTKALGTADPGQRLSEAADGLRTLGEQLKLQDEEREGLLEAAGFGLAIGITVHEAGKLAAAIVSDADQLRDAIGNPPAEQRILSSLKARAEALSAEVKRLAPLRLTRIEAARPISVRGAAEVARNAFQQTLKDGHIELTIGRGDFRAKARFGAIAQVFANLFDNAIYWIGGHAPRGSINLVLSAENRTVTISDSGPGVSKTMRPHLFEPFYSEKSPPSGLGLFICRHYLSQCNATIRLIQPDPTDYSGAQFLLDFSKTPAE
jgi:signal transduction histidine kinase